MMNAPTRFGGGRLHLLYEDQQEEPETPEESTRAEKLQLWMALSYIAMLIAVLIGFVIFL